MLFLVSRRRHRFVCFFSNYNARLQEYRSQARMGTDAMVPLVAAMVYKNKKEVVFDLFLWSISESNR